MPTTLMREYLEHPYAIWSAVILALLIGITDPQSVLNRKPREPLVAVATQKDMERLTVAIERLAATGPIQVREELRQMKEILQAQQQVMIEIRTLLNIQRLGTVNPQGSLQFNQGHIVGFVKGWQAQGG